VRLVSYNVLADAYRNPDWYRDSPIDWHHRDDLLLAHINSFHADLICLQEMELRRFHAFEKQLPMSGAFSKKSNPKPDGCAAFFNLSLLEEATLFYDDRGKGHIAQILHFENFSVANTHLKWDAPGTPLADQIGLLQINQLIDTIAKHPQNPWLIVGDLNAQPGTPVIDALLDAGFTISPPGPTCNIDRRPQQIDYICTGPDLIAAFAPLPPITAETILPNNQNPSDHLAIFCSVEVD
jgi:mRNA deadenylase 3'-5' endonuclease subunit Ccr4